MLMPFPCGVGPCQSIIHIDHHRETFLAFIRVYAVEALVDMYFKIFFIDQSLCREIVDDNTNGLGDAGRLDIEHAPVETTSHGKSILKRLDP